MIKNLIFDAGGVLVGYRWERMLEERGLSEENANRIGNGSFENDVWNEIDSGRISFHEFLEGFCSDNKDIEEDIRWFFGNAIEMRVPRPKLYEVMEALKKKGYNLYVLSNYCQYLFDIHLNDIGVRELMDGEIISANVKVMKPDRRIYEIITEKFNLIPGECVFFDDREENCQAAIDFGMAAVKVKDQSEELLISELEKFL